jgi:hypothetical protein
MTAGQIRPRGFSVPQGRLLQGNLTSTGSSAPKSPAEKAMDKAESNFKKDKNGKDKVPDGYLGREEIERLSGGKITGEEYDKYAKSNKSDKSANADGLIDAKEFEKLRKEHKEVKLDLTA